MDLPLTVRAHDGEVIRRRFNAIVHLRQRAKMVYLRKSDSKIPV
jgi:hypothetical protein